MVFRCISLLPPATDITMALSHDEPTGPLSEPSVHVTAVGPHSSTAISARRCSLRPELNFSSEPHGPLRLPLVYPDDTRLLSWLCTNALTYACASRSSSCSVSGVHACEPRQ